MISQRCPHCKSSRIRRGYEPTPFYLKLLCRYNLLCDNCNWLFRGFAVPGTVEFSSPRRKSRRAKASETRGGVELNYAKSRKSS
jgi:hypothetical protein